MGCTSPQNVSHSHIPANHLQRLLVVSDINHVLNVNKKYEHLSKIRQGVYVGEGFKKCFGYDCLTTPEQLYSKRRQFWETRVNGQPDCWKAIRAAVENKDQNHGQAILQSVHVSMLNNNIQMCVDARFNKYEVPVFCLSEPLSYSRESMAQKNLNYTYDDATLQVRIRSVKYPTGDISIALSSNALVQDLKAALRKQKSVPPQEKIRFFYNGREMMDSKTLGNYNYKVGTMIQAMIRE